MFPRPLFGNPAACFLPRMSAEPTIGDSRARPPAKRDHIIDTLIEERAPKLSHTAYWPLLRPILYSVLNYKKARRMADIISVMRGYDALEFVSRLLDIKLDNAGMERIPKTGAFIMLANHPTGITDGMAVYDAVKTIRPDVMFYANSDAHRVCRGFDDCLIPVEWVAAKRTRERTRVTLKMTEEALTGGRPIVVFPAGRLARRRDGVLVDPEWMSSATSFARKYRTPIVPCHVAGPEAFWFHTFAKISPELRDITLFHELLNKAGKTYHLSFGPLIPPEHAIGDAAAVTRRLKHYVERVLSADANAVFDPNGPECQWRDPPPTGAAAMQRVPSASIQSEA